MDERTSVVEFFLLLSPSSFLLHRVTIFLQYVQTREKSENERSLCFYETFLISLPKIRELEREKILHEERRHVNPSFNKEKKRKTES